MLLSGVLTASRRSFPNKVKGDIRSMYPRSEILFPHSCTRRLRNLLDKPWAELIDRVLQADEASEISLAFSLMMIHLCGCLNCDMGSYKASLGCAVCSQRAVATARGNSKLLLKRFEKARQQVRHYLETGTVDWTDDWSEEPLVA